MKKNSFLVLLAAGAVSMSACFGANHRVYIACPGVGIRVADFDSEAGKISEPREAISLTGTGFLVIHPSQPLLYATCSLPNKDGGVAAFKIADEGTLELLNRQSTGGRNTCHVSLDAKGQVAFGANYGSGSVASFRVIENGKLSEVVSKIEHEGSSVHPQRQQRPFAHYITAGPRNRFVYATDLGTDKVEIYQFERDTAKLRSVGEAKLKPGAGPRHLKFSQSGKEAYVLNELDLTVTVFDCNTETGALTVRESVSVVPDGERRDSLTCAEIRVHPSGKFVVTSQRDLETRAKDYEGGVGRNSLSVFRVTEKGSLERLATISAKVRVPRNFNFDPSGKWLLAGGQSSNEIQVFSFDDASGDLEAHGEAVPCPSPICFEFVAAP